jgi:hypothetical protein
MNKKMIVLSAMLVIIGGIATLGVVAGDGMTKKGVNTMPEGRSEYAVTDQELQQLEQELKTEEEMPAVEPNAPVKEQTPVEEEEEGVTEKTIPTPTQEPQAPSTIAPAPTPAPVPTAPEAPEDLEENIELK